jgi:hypothetical protein
MFRRIHQIFGISETWHSNNGIFEFKFIIDITTYKSSGNSEDIIKNNDDKIKIFVSFRRKPSDLARTKKYNKLSEFNADKDLYKEISKILETKLH